MVTGTSCSNLARIWSDNTFGNDLVPERFGCAVIQHEIAVVEHARNAKLCDLSAHIATNANRRATQRAPGDGNGVTADRVVDDFMVVKNPGRVMRAARRRTK